ncbi:MAG TPA: glycyl-radical enzyme activating protein [Chloroflexi bacterium]|nr:glycyl-radical enzyme activating protein [Chloroflexota bacterium]
MTVTGRTFNIQRFSTRDGPGIRTTIFFKGCPLRCPWCHNPEGLSPQTELVWYESRCIGIRDCLAACPEGALELTPQGMHIARQRCTACGACAEACPSGALEIIGQEWTVEELLTETAKDVVFYETSGGGVTLSGGEPMQQADFITALARQCREAGISVALDTCGAAPWEDYERLLPWADLVLYDLKLWDAARHQAVTGLDNRLILDNVRRIASTGARLWIRTPIIPGYTADAENVAALGDFIAAALPAIERWELLAYTHLGQPKYQRLSRSYALEGAPLLSQAEMEALHAVAAERVERAVWTGVTRGQANPDGGAAP